MYGQEALVCSLGRTCPLPVFSVTVVDSLEVLGMQAAVLCADFVLYCCLKC